MRRRRKASPWARIALREPLQFRWWSFCKAPAARRAESLVYEHTVLVALILPLLGWVVAWVEPVLGLALCSAAVAVALWIPGAGRRMRRIRVHCLEHVRRRHARRYPRTPEWNWALLRAQERSLGFNITPVTDPLCTAVVVIALAVIMASFNVQLQEWLGGKGRRGEIWDWAQQQVPAGAERDFSTLPLPAGAALAAGALGIGLARAERDRRRLRQPMLHARCLRCGYRLMETALRRESLRCRVCPECGYWYPLHPPPISGRVGVGMLPRRM